MGTPEQDLRDREDAEAAAEMLIAEQERKADLVAAIPRDDLLRALAKMIESAREVEGQALYLERVIGGVVSRDVLRAIESVSDAVIGSGIDEVASIIGGDELDAIEEIF